MLFLQGQDGSGHESWLYAGKIPMGTLLLLVDPDLTWTWGRVWLLLTCTICLLRLELHLFPPNSSPVCISHTPDSESMLGTQSVWGIVIWKNFDYSSAKIGWCVPSCGWEMGYFSAGEQIQMADKVLILFTSLSPWGSFGANQNCPWVKKAMNHSTALYFSHLQKESLYMQPSDVIFPVKNPCARADVPWKQHRSLSGAKVNEL